MPLFIGSYETAEIGRKTKNAGFSCDRLASRTEEAGVGESAERSQIHPKLDINSHYTRQMPRKSLPRTPLSMQPANLPDASNGIPEQSRFSSVDDTQHKSEEDILSQQICETQNKPSQAAPPDNLAPGSEVPNDDLVQMKASQGPQTAHQIGDESLPAKRSDLTEAEDDVFIQKEPPQVYESVTVVQPTWSEAPVVTTTEPPQVRGPSKELTETQPEALETPSKEQPLQPSSLTKRSDEVSSVEPSDLGKSDDDILVQTEPPLVYESVTSVQATDQKTEKVAVSEPLQVHEPAREPVETQPETPEASSLEGSPQETNEEACESAPQQTKSKNFEVTQDASLTAGTLESDSLRATHEKPSSDIQVNSKPTNVARLEPVSPLDEIRKLRQDFQNIKNATSDLQHLLSSIANKGADSRTADNIKKVHDLAESLPQMKTQLEANIEQYKSYVEQKKALNEKPAFTVENMLNELTEALNDLENVQKDYMEFNQNVDTTAPTRKKSWNLFGRRQDRV